ncbi:MAG: hypothetical protein Q9174_003241 [Haloplaca sp. 1 TL-2023]
MERASGLDSKVQAYELVQRSRSESYALPPPTESDDGIEKSTTRLPPKPLPGRRKFRPFIIATSATVLSIVALAVLIRSIQNWMPDLGTYSYRTLVGGPSCDLIDTKNSSRMESAFQINLRGAAHLSFAEAKFIDLVFDLIVGQGGRLLLGALSYIVFVDALIRFMEITPVSYDLYTSLVFSSTSLISTWQAAKAVSTTKGWRVKLYLIWSSLAMIYVLAFPTLVESATGYLQPSSAGFNTKNGTVVKSDSDELLSCFNVTGGAFLGLNNGSVITGPPVHDYDALLKGDFHVDPEYIPDSVDRNSTFWTLLTYDPTNSTIYNATNSTDDPFDLALQDWRENRANNYSAGSYGGDEYWADGYGGDNARPYSGDFDRNFTMNVTIDGEMRIVQNIYIPSLWDAEYCYGDTVLDYEDLRDNPFCLSKPYFVWGFSSIVLYVILGLQMVWTIGMYCVWLDAHICSEFLRHGRNVRGSFRGAADLVEAMNETLGDEYCAYTDKEIEKHLEASGKKLKYYSSLRDDDELLHVGMTTTPGSRVLLSQKMLYGAENKARRKRVG